MAEGNWFLVGSLVILLNTAAVTHCDGGCWTNVSHSLDKETLTVYNCTYQNFHVLSTETLDPKRSYIDLTYLYLVKNKIWFVDRDVFHHLQKLECIVLSGNVIGSLHEDVFSYLKSLYLLDLSFNRLSVLPDRLFSSQDYLQSLLLLGNQLRTISVQLLTPLKSLQKLDLSFNYLSVLPDRLFSSQDQLQTLLLQENQLRTISVSLLSPLISITSLNLSNNQFLCDCELRLAMFWCKDRMLDTEATCQNQVSGNMSQWTQLEFVNNCLENPVPSVLSKSVTTPYTKPEDRVVAVSSYVVTLIIVGAVTFQFLCFGLFLLYLRRRRPPAVSTTREERSVLSDSSSSHNYQYDYIQIPDIYTTPQLPARPIQTVGDLGPVQVDTCHSGHSGIHLKEPALCGTVCGSCEAHHMTEPESKKSHLNNKQPVSSGVISPIPYDLPEYDNPSKMAVSNFNAINRSSDASVMVENCLYSV